MDSDLNLQPVIPVHLTMLPATHAGAQPGLPANALLVTPCLAHLSGVQPLQMMMPNMTEKISVFHNHFYESYLD